MAGWKEVLANFVVDVEHHYDMLKYRLRESLGGRDPIMIQPYRGYGTPKELYLKGRVLENKGIPPAGEDDSIWENLVNMYKRFESDEIPYARVLARFQGVEQEVQANEEGFFEVYIECAEALPEDKQWHTIELELLEPLREGYPPVHAEGQVLVPVPNARFGAISDIDDTVLQTDVTHLIRMARTVFLGNARTRLPFKGVAAFYRALFHGAHEEIQNPLFYVSSSPWNIYDLLSEFFNLQNIPIGPIMFLRDWGISKDELLPTTHRSHKLRAIRKILDLYQDLPFILIGDSGQEDPEIYAEAVDLYPNRIPAIYIRNVSRDLKRPEAIRELAKKVAEAGSTLILADDTLPLAQHALEQGWISPEAMPEIEVEKAADEAPPSPLETLLGEEEEAEAPTVVVEAGSTEATKEAVDEGVIEEALKTEAEQTKKPPAVKVEGEKKEDGG